MIAEDYVRMVAFELRDLPWRMRRALVEELRGHLDELPPGTSLGERLGRPHEYAAEMRAAAGLERRRGLIAFLRARRPRNLILTLVTLTVIGLAVGAVAWINSYQPLEFQNGEALPFGAVEAPGGNSESVVFHKGRPFRLGIDVSNRGRFTVRVVAAGYMGERYPFSARLLISQPMRANFAGFPPPFERFHPFDLKPGQARALMLRGVYAHCRNWRGGGATTFVDFPVRFRFLWRTAVAEITLPEQLAIVFPKGFRCDAKP
jgi:hypothetical protein